MRFSDVTCSDLEKALMTNGVAECPTLMKIKHTGWDSERREHKVSVIAIDSEDHTYQICTAVVFLAEEGLCADFYGAPDETFDTYEAACIAFDCVEEY